MTTAEMLLPGSRGADPPGALRPKRGDLVRSQALVAGEWVDDPSGRTFPVINPATGMRIAEVTDGGEALARRAVDAAIDRFATWRDATVKTRSQVLRRWSDLIVSNAEDLARLISWEVGKPLSEARAEAVSGAAYIEWFAEEIRRSNGEIVPAPVEGRRALVLLEPVGVVAVITPWNFPLAMIARKLGPALAAGCTVVAKPSEDTPLSANALAVLALEAGLPPGAFNVVPASRERTPDVSAAWMADARVRKVSFTGSTAVGKRLAEASASTLKRLSLELGGDAPFIIFDDADLDVATEALTKAKFRNAGQACIAANRVLVQDAVFDAVVDRMVERVRALTVGPPAEGAFDIGPLINARAVEKVDRVLAEAKAGGARVLVGGGRHGRGGGFYEPTVLVDMPPASRGGCEEVFGPVLALSRFQTEAEAIALASATAFGLAAYVCTDDLRRAWRVAEQLESGMVGVNEGLITTETAPFGGVKASGYGREGSIHGLAEYQSLKYVCIGGVRPAP